MSKTLRVLAGLATVIGVSLLIELLTPLNAPVDRFLASSGLGTFMVFVAGGYVARSSFIIPAIVFSIAAWAGAVYFAWRIATAAEGTGFAEVAMNNWQGLVLYTVAAMAGAAVGMWLYAFRSSLWLLDH